MNDKELTILKKLSLSPEWEMLKRLSDEIISDIRSRPKLQNTEWETLKSVVGDESEIRGVTSLIQKVHLLARQAK